MTNFIYLDFEYNNILEAKLNLVCMSAYDSETNETVEFWLHGRDYSKARDWIESRRTTHTFVAYAVTAEGRSLHSLGLNPVDFTWIDLFVEWKLLTNRCDRWSYGKQLVKGKIAVTTSPKIKKEVETRIKMLEERGWAPAHLAERDEDTGNYNQPEGNLGAATYKMLGKVIDTERKTLMRDIIIRSDPVEIEAHREEIQAYCTSDIEYLPKLHEAMQLAVRSTYGEKVANQAEERARHAAATAVVEARGMPIDRDICERLGAAIPDIMHSGKTKVNDKFGQEIYWPMHPVMGKKGKPLKLKQGVFKVAKIGEWLKEQGIEDWEQTSRGPSMQDKYLKSRMHLHPALRELRGFRRLAGDLKWLDTSRKLKDGDRHFIDRLGSDSRIRPYYGIYGTQTGRNAASAKTFPLAMSSGLRSMFRAPPGQTMFTLDYGGQEVAIAAMLSQDKAMQQAYESLDPYSDFAIRAGAMPTDEFEEKLKELGDRAAATKFMKGKYPEIRQIYKGVVLGVQYGMGAEALAEVLTSSTKKPWTKEQAKELLQKHMEAYPDFWRWRNATLAIYENLGQPLELGGGWCLGPDNPNSLSVANAPIQGAGAAILRRAQYLAVREGIPIVAPLHDALYAVSDSDKAEGYAAALQVIMDQAITDILGELATFKIRIDVDLYPHDKLYVVEKAESFYNEFKHIIDPPKAIAS